MPGNIDSTAQEQRKREAVQGAVSTTVFRIAVAVLLLWLCRGQDMVGFLPKLLVVVALLNLGTIIPLWIALKTRLKEIEGGEEDAAAQY